MKTPGSVVSRRHSNGWRKESPGTGNTSGDNAIESGFNYDEIAEAYAAGVDSAPYNAHYERPATLALLPDVAGKHVLDAGCGSGFYIEELIRRGARVTGIDASGEMLKHAERRVESIGGNAELHVWDLSHPFDFLADESVDGILAPLVLHYLEDWGPTLREFLRVLTSGGWLVLSTHHPTTEAARFNIPNYFAVERLEDYWSWCGTVKFYRRPLSAITGAVTSAGFVIDTLSEPLPDEIFRTTKPEAYERILKHPDFLMIRARKLG